MKIGVFDSGLGGLLLAHSIQQALPEYDYLYLGDTARVPYGNRSQETIYRFTEEAVDYLFRHDCRLVVLACNTASAEALRRVQQEYLPRHYPERRVLGVLIPAAEDAVAASESGRIGVLATQATVQSRAFVHEIIKLRPDAQVLQQSAPLLVPLIELGGVQYARPILADYLAPLRAASVESLVLGCTHYPVLKAQIEEEVGPSVRVIDQNTVVPAKLRDYLRRHPEMDRHLSRTGRRIFLVTDVTPSMTVLAEQWFGRPVPLELLPSLEERP
jgi:glutamate racemase